MVTRYEVDKKNVYKNFFEMERMLYDPVREVHVPGWRPQRDNICSVYMETQVYLVISKTLSTHMHNVYEIYI